MTATGSSPPGGCILIPKERVSAIFFADLGQRLPPLEGALSVYGYGSLRFFVVFLGEFVTVSILKQVVFAGSSCREIVTFPL